MKFISDDETVGRALFEPEWDPTVKRLTPSAFTRCNTSVTRLLSNEPTLINYLKSDVENGKVKVQAVGLITVSQIKSIGLESETKIHFEVNEAITEKNPHHAEVLPFDDEARQSLRKNVSKGVSRKITHALNLLILDATGSVTERIESGS
ncbi:hypothetical protein [Erwinia rhapontici]|uniref:hypothetical protein n=1 Tax=Erwinia rhapontici TaxID=55212 RepID=UPI003BA0B507